jgi:hypothetical protein
MPNKFVILPIPNKFVILSEHSESKDLLYCRRRR